MKKLKHTILNILTLGAYKRRKRPTKSENYIKDIRELTLNYQTKELQKAHKNPLNKFGKKCFSQTDEDGITLEILRRIGCIENGYFAEFGPGDGMENNTLILKSLGWKGFWIGGENLTIDAKSNEKFCFIKEFISLKNIIELTLKGKKEINCDYIDVISFDLDGNDLFLVDELLKNNFKPKLFIVEYNGKFPPPIQWRMNYNEKHIWDGSDYYGASLASFNELFVNNDYELICCNAHTGSNAFFIKKEYLKLFDDVPKNIEDIYVPPRYFLHNVFGSHSFSHPQSVKTINKLFE
jgi:hypothetical protein